MSNPWFRMYGEFANDPKVQMLSEADQRRLVMMFCARSSNCNETLHETPNETHVTFSDDSIAFQLRISLEEWLRTKALFVQRGFLNEQNVLLNWNKRQYRSDSSTARVRAHRNSVKQQVEQTGNADETKRNVTVTPPDTDTDTDKRKEKAVAKGEKAFVLPDWISQDVWKGFAEMRKQIKKPLSPLASALIVTELIKLKSSGADPNAIIEQSTRNSWQDVFPLRNKGQSNQAVPADSSPAAQRRLA